MKKHNVLIGMLFSVAAVLLAVLIAGNILAFGVYDTVLVRYFGTRGGSAQNYSTNQYFERKESSAEAASAAAAKLSYQVEAEGAVLLQNDNGALPLSQGIKVSCFSQSSVDFIYGTFGGSGEIDTSNVSTLSKALKERANITANPVLESFYQSKTQYRRKTGGLSGGAASKDPYKWKINEVPYSEYTDEVKSSYASYGDAAIVVVARTGCENGDLPRDMSKSDSSNHGSLLELDATEKEMFTKINEQFDKIIVLLNTGNQMECGFLKEYGVDACLWVGGVGQFGMEAVVDLLVGKENPSGRLVDTYVYDVFSSPAMQNMGNFIYTNENGTLSNHRYVNYGEGIYVGYKYYETRYEDVVLGAASAGDYVYDEVVQFPFGYGISYTQFEWSNYTAKVENGNITVSVDVKNVGTVAGKDVVEVYYQSPYTDYDKENKVEKSAVELAGFVKTKTLQAQEKQTVSYTFPTEQLKSYDAFGKGTYYLEGGSESNPYYITVAKDAHSGIRNILQAKGKDVQGDQAAVRKFTAEIEEKIYDVDTVSGNTVGNLFDGCAPSDAEYVSRQNWTKMDSDGLRYGTVHGQDNDGTTYKHVISASLKEELEKTGYEAAGAPAETFTEPTVGRTGESAEVSLIEMRNKSFEDEKWEKLLDGVSKSEMVQFIKLSGYGTPIMKTINKPDATDADGPSAWNSYIGDGTNSGGFPYAVVIASTWNTELAEQVGDVMGELCLWAKVKSADASGEVKDPNLTGWYAPAMNIHRTPFGGRNFEYYSECAMVSAKIGSAVVKGATQRGVLCYIKHFAFNEQETNRMRDNVVWAQEQCLREIYLKPFEYSVKEGKTLGLMTAYNRIGTVWTGGSYNLITRLLRNEWGFNGFVITDYMDGDYENIDQMLAAGGDAALNNNSTKRLTTNTAQAITYFRRATKHMLYAFVNSNGMNGIDDTTVVAAGMPRYYGIMAGIDVGLGICVSGCVAIAVWQIVSQKKKMRMAQ